MNQFYFYFFFDYLCELFRQFNKNYSYPHSQMYPYYRYLSELEAENAFRRSRLEADMALSRAAT